MSKEFKPLSSGEVLSIDPSVQVMIGHGTFRISEFNAELKRLMLEQNIGGLNAEKSGWLTEDGVPCEVLKFGSNGWTKGRVRLYVEFCPDGEEGESSVPKSEAVAAVVAASQAVVEPAALSMDDGLDFSMDEAPPEAIAAMDDLDFGLESADGPPSETVTVLDDFAGVAERSEDLFGEVDQDDVGNLLEEESAPDDDFSSLLEEESASDDDFGNLLEEESAPSEASFDEGFDDDLENLLDEESVASESSFDEDFGADFGEISGDLLEEIPSSLDEEVSFDEDIDDLFGEDLEADDPFAEASSEAVNELVSLELDSEDSGNFDSESELETTDLDFDDDFGDLGDLLSGTMGNFGDGDDFGEESSGELSGGESLSDDVWDLE